MREFITTVRESLTKGLRPDRNVKGRGTFLEECYNMKPTPFGLEAYTSPYDPFQGNVTTDWPWPQLFYLKDGSVLLCEETEISVVNTSVAPWTLTALEAKDPTAPGTSKAIPSGGGVWHLADLGESWYLFKGNATVFKTGLHQIEGGAPRYFVDDTVTIQTGCVHKGRILIGGFDSSNFWNSDWEAIFTAWQSNAAPSGINFQYDDPGPSWVAWSSIGGGDLPLWLFFPSDIASSLGIDLSEDALLQRVRRNEMGFMQLNSRANGVQRLLPLGPRVIAYGRSSVTALEPMQSEVSPYTYGTRLVDRIGTAERGAVAGSQNSHAFITSDGELYLLDSELSLQRLGYKEYLLPLSNGEVVSHYDPYESTFYFSNNQLGYGLTESGLFEHKDRFTGLYSAAGESFAISHNAETSDIEVVTQELNMQLSARKRVNNVHIDYTSIIDLTAEVIFRYDTGDFTDFRSVGEVGVNKEGVAHQRVTGVDFKVRLRGGTSSIARVTQIGLRYQADDKRAIRGIFQDAN